MIIDFHAHIFSPRINQERDAYLGRDPVFNILYADHRAKLASAEDIVRSMDEAGVDVSVVLNIGWTSHELCVETNDYLMEASARYPKRLVGFGVVQPKAGEAALREIERCAKGGLRGIGEMRADAQGYDMGDEALMKPLLEQAQKHNMILLTHSSEPVGHRYQGKGMITPEVLYRFVSLASQADVVLAHWGGGLPFYALMPEVARAFERVSFDTAAWSFLYGGDIFKYGVSLVGAQKILFGTDYPLLGQKKSIQRIRDLNLEKTVEAAILGENARRLLKLG